MELNNWKEKCVVDWTRINCLNFYKELSVPCYIRVWHFGIALAVLVYPFLAATMFMWFVRTRTAWWIVGGLLLIMYAVVQLMHCCYVGRAMAGDIVSV